MALFERLRSEPVYNTRAVVQRTGVPADTFRAWERRYGLPKPSRTPGNQRLYSERDIALISWLRDQTRGGLTVSQAVALFRSTDAESCERAARPATTGDALNPLARLREAMVEALIAFDAPRTDAVCAEALALLPVEDVCLRAFQPVLMEIGDRFARGQIGVGPEHFATAFVLRKLGTLFNLSRPDIGRGPVVAACAEGEQHEVGLLLVSLFLSRHGCRVLYLGANLPQRDLVATVRRLSPPLVLLSASTPITAETLITGAAEIARLRLPDAAPVVGYGGRIFDAAPELRERVPALFLGRDAAEAVDVVDPLLNRAAA